MNNNKTLKMLLASSLAVTFIMASGAVFASSGYIGIHSIDSLGRASAGDVAMAESAGAIAKNPALIMRLESGSNVSLGAAYTYGDWRAKEISPYKGADTEESINDKNNETGNFGPRNIPLPGNHYAKNMGDWGFGVSVSSFFGGLLDYGNENFRHTEIADNMTLLTANLQFDVAKSISPQLAVGAGVDFAYGYAEVNRRFGDLSGTSIVGPDLYNLLSFAANEQLDPNSSEVPFIGDILDDVLAVAPNLSAFLDPNKDLLEIRAESMGFGWHAGLSYQVDEKLDLGFSYRSRVDHKYEGGYESDLPVMPEVWGVIGTDGEERGVTFTAIQPAIAEAAFSYKASNLWQLHGSVAWQQWSDFQSLDLYDDDNVLLASLSLPHHDQFKYSLGATYQYSDKLKLRAGVALDQTAVDGKDASISLPSSDRYWLSGGFNYILSESSDIDFAISYAKNNEIKNKEKSLIADVVLEPFPDAESLNDLLNIVNIDPNDFNLGGLGDIPLDLPLNDFVNSLYSEEGPYYEQTIKAELFFVGLQWNKRF